MFIFQCSHCEVLPCYLNDVIGQVLCGNCHKVGDAVKLSQKEIKDLDLTIVED